MNKVLLFSLSIALLISCRQQPTDALDGNQQTANKSWALNGFEKVDADNPCLLPSDEPSFECPIRLEKVYWEEKDVFNPAVVVKNGRVHMIYRAEDVVGVHNGTSRLGLAISDDGLHFQKESKPIFYPDHDSLYRYEWEGGIEDPRIVETEEGSYIMTYTSYDGKTARLCVASSPDLRQWDKHGLAFGGASGGKYLDLWSKSGAIVCRVAGEKFIAQKVKDRYWMYWGDKHLYLATSENLLDWRPVEENGELKIIMSYRPGYFDSDLVEPGPPAMLTEKGILLIYNGRNYGPDRDPMIEEGTYSAGQALFAAADPGRLIDRLEENFFRPEKDYEIFGQVNKVVFLEGLVPFKGKWFLYYGTADSKIAVATTVLE